ncbi:MAG: UvrD-helicase domain-containing protein, partial [Bacteroidota bacterium]
ARHPGLGALAFADGWSLDRLLEHQDLATRYEATDILPEAEPLADALARLGDAVDHLANVWDTEAALAVIDRAAIKKKAGALHADARSVFSRVGAFARGETRHLGAVRDSVTEAVAEAISYANREPGKTVVASVQRDPGFAACTRVAEAADRVEHALVHAFVTGTEARFPDLKRRAGLLDADDLISRLRDALAHERTGPRLAEAIRAQFAVALVDEFQDTDPRQYDVFRLGLGARDGHPGRPRFFIGDPKQAIYAFRGADVFAYLRAKADTAPARRFTLGRNHRSSPALVEAVNTLFARMARPFVYAGIPFERVGVAAEAAGIRGIEPEAPFVWWDADGLDRYRGVVSKDPARDTALQATVDEICALLASDTAELYDPGTEAWRRLRPSDIAVLVRTNDQARDVQDALREKRVPAVVARGADIRESRMFEEIERVMLAVARPGDTRRVRAALGTELLGWTADRLGDPESAADVAEAAGRFREYRTWWRRGGIFGMWTALADREGVWDEMRRYRDAERRVTNLRHVLELLHEAESAAERSVDELLLWVRARKDHTFSESSRVEMRLESDARAVQLVTMHNSKGLEYPIVFAPYLWDAKETVFWSGGGFREKPPLAHTENGRTVYDLDATDDIRALAEAERLAEHLRLVYVALTRARERLYTLWGPLSGAHMSGLGALLRGVPLPLQGPLARLGEDEKTTAKEALRSGTEPLRTWIADSALNQPRPRAADPRPLMSVEPLPEPGPVITPEVTTRTLQPPRPVSRSLRRQATTHPVRASFSAWASGAPRDDRFDDDPMRSGTEADEIGLFGFAAGPHAGTCLHEVLQHAEFHNADAYDPPPVEDPHDSGQRRVVRSVLLRHGLLAPRAHRAEIEPLEEACRLIQRLARAEVPQWGVRLGERLGTDGYVAEWRFVAPLGHTSPAALARVFEEHGSDALADYADALRRLRADEAEGLFVGSADLVVNVGTADAPRWALVDWKSNHLGPTPADYAPDALARVMRRHHYLFQAHLYVAGLHRHLRVRLGAAYDYDRHVAGIAYVFLRGIAEDGATGFHVEQPSRDLVEALEATLFAPLHA